MRPFEILCVQWVMSAGGRKLIVQSPPPLLRQTDLYVENSFVDFYCCQMVTQIFSLSPSIAHNFLRSLPSSTVPVHVMKLLQAHLEYTT